MADPSFFNQLWSVGSVVGILGNLAASYLWDNRRRVGEQLRYKIPAVAELLASGGSNQNHHVLRALRRAECRALVTLCDQSLRDDFGIRLDSASDQLGLLVRTNTDVEILCRIRRTFSRTYDDLGAMSPEQLSDLLGADVREVPALVKASSECFSAQSADELRQRLVDQQIGDLNAILRVAPAKAGLSSKDSRPLAENGLPPTLTRQLEKHPKGWWDMIRLAFREELKDPANEEARKAWEMDVLSQMSQQLGDSFVAFDNKFTALDAKLSGFWEELRSLRKPIEEALNAITEFLAKVDATTSQTLDTVGAVKDDTQALLRGQEELQKGVSQLLLQKIQTTAQSSPNDSEEEIFEKCQVLVAQLDRGEFEQVLAHKARSFEEYRARCIARWSRPRFAVDKRFTPLTLLLDQGEEAGERYQRASREFTDLRDVLKAVEPTKEPVIVVTGAPGSGKSTLLRRLELDLASAALRSGNPDAPLTIFLPLNAFGQRGSAIPDPKAWVAQQWADSTEGLLEFDALLGRPLVLLLDGLNEMPHASNEDYDDRLTFWKNFLDRLVRDHPKVRVVFSCRTLDYGAKLPTKDLPRVPQVEVNALTSEQVQAFLKCYSPESVADRLYAQLKDSPQLDLYRSPFYLRLLIEQAADGVIPEGRAALFTGYVRAMLKREIDGENPLIQKPPLLHDRDLKLVRERRWTTPYELPARGPLFNKLAAFAFRLQERRGPGDKSQVRVDYDRALENLSDVPANQQDELLKAAADLQILELPGDDVLFVHQLLQEYFAARHVAERVSAVAAVEAVTEFARLAQVKWLEKDIQPSVAEELQTLPKSGTLPDLDTTGWEETFTLAAALLLAPDAFLRALAQYNLPLAGRSAAQSDVKVSQNQINELRKALLERSRDPATDLRARITAGLALGALGDHRFEAGQGPDGCGYLLPPLVQVDGGFYTIGSNDGIEADEAPVHEVELAPFSLGQFPVTNAEYRCFVDAKGYEDERWWEGDTARRWRRGEGTAEADRNNWRIWRDRFKREAGLLERLNDEQAWTRELLGQWQSYCAMTDEDFESVLRDRFRDQRFTEPRFWHDAAYNAPNQPVVGVCWYEARAYCAWLSAQTGQPFRLPSEAEWEAAARGKTRTSDDGQPLSEGRRYAWGDQDESFSTSCNTLETKLRRTTPIGVFPDGDTPAGTKPNGLADMTGNVWEWTSSVYDQEKYRYPYKANDGREDDGVDSPRVLRGGSWLNDRVNCRCAYRYEPYPSARGSSCGFRVCCAPPII